MPIVVSGLLANIPFELLIRRDPERNPVQLLAVLYDLHDAKRWVTKFIAKHKNTGIQEIIPTLEKISQKLTKLINHYSSLINKKTL